MQGHRDRSELLPSMLKHASVKKKVFRQLGETTESKVSKFLCGQSELHSIVQF